jgi:hypothetical protein
VSEPGAAAACCSESAAYDVRQLLLFVEWLLHPAGYVRRKFGMLGGVPGGEQRHRQAAEIADDSAVVAREKRGSCDDESIRE